MTVQVPLYEGALTLDQWQLVEGLASTLTPEQARWISGYFAGLDAGLLRAGGGEIAPVVAPSGPHADRSSTAARPATAATWRKTLAAAATAQGLAPKVADMADYKVRAAQGRAGRPVHRQHLWRGRSAAAVASASSSFSRGRKAPKLDGVRFSVLALGDSTYEYYCEAGKRVDSRLEELGATRLSPRVDCDVDYDDPAAAGARCVVQLARRRSGSFVAAEALRQHLARIRRRARTTSAIRSHATVLENIPIVGRHSTKETRHVELDLGGSGLTYQPGDALGIVANNDPRVVAALLEADRPVRRCAAVDGEGRERSRWREALDEQFRDHASRRPRFLEHWAEAERRDGAASG